MHNQFKTQKFKHLMLAMGPRDLNSAPYSPVHCSSHSMTSFQSSERTGLPVVENSQLFAQRAHSARYAPIVSIFFFHSKGGAGGWCAPPPCDILSRVVSLRGPGQSPVLPFACCVGSLLSVGRCGRCSCWCRCRVRGAQWLVVCPPPPPPPQPQPQWCRVVRRSLGGRGRGVP